MEDVKKDSKENIALKNFFRFDRMITPAIIQIVFYIGLAASVLIGLGQIITGIASRGGSIQIFTGIIVLVISPIIVRVYCELLIVIFKIHESLGELKDKQ
ncbi:hypothetical protein Curi_c05390 [Gottschalkia acidurici 9a]|uniref:DUF4282 domain-containing protein n=1 Tax=Gottschalkia acidurici (strain ATCC 7906 / DSM 604 / BCRC 14475 / CIP 104303 / KCTC 5404 / NCIMB 10678 / 9a) TaxID=1128398 RepID=K0AWK0_GOTA9|nr:DUF4282 domain-containing protein [Gottschalkia acidurici]AFS77614.1 hypothetical protein Curi_c05390 [Gottschalkia acidurici 9a]